MIQIDADALISHLINTANEQLVTHTRDVILGGGLTLEEYRTSTGYIRGVDDTLALLISETKKKIKEIDDGE